MPVNCVDGLQKIPTKFGHKIVKNIQLWYLIFSIISSGLNSFIWIWVSEKASMRVTSLLRSHGFGHSGNNIKNQVWFTLSPFEQNPTKNFLGKGIPNLFRRIKEQIVVISIRKLHYRYNIYIDWMMDFSDLPGVISLARCQFSNSRIYFSSNP